MNSRAYTTSITLVAILSVCLLSLVCCGLLSFALFGLQADQQRGSISETTVFVVSLFSCCGLCLPTLPLAAGGISYLFARNIEREVEQSLAATPAQHGPNE